MKNVEIDPYNEEIWDENAEKNYTVIKNLFPGLQAVVKKNLTKEKAKEMCRKLNMKEGDAYASYSYEKMRD